MDGVRCRCWLVPSCLQHGGDECGQLFWQIITLSGADDVKQLLRTQAGAITNSINRID